MNQEPTETTNAVSNWAEDRLQADRSPEQEALKAFPCPQCEASFDTAQQRQGHISGKHRRKTSTPTTRAGQLNKKRLYNARMRARYIAMGLTSAGKERKTGRAPRGTKTPALPAGEIPYYKTPEYKRRRYLMMKRRNLAAGLTVRGDKPRLSSTGLRNIRMAQRARRKRELLNGTSITAPPPEQQPPPQLDIAGAAEQIVQCARTLVNLATINRIP